MCWTLRRIAVTCAAFLTLSSCGLGESPTITVDPSVRYQTMVGWEASAQAGHIECPASAYDRYRDELFDRAVNELGINRLRIPLRSGVENPADYFADNFDKFRSKQITFGDFKKAWYQVVNDNDDPEVIDSAGFHFSELDFTIEKVVLPLKQRVEARGEKLYINLNYTDFGPSPFEHRDFPAEYAELMLAAFQHLERHYGWVPDGIEVILEPDNSNWSGEQAGRAIAAAGERLEAAGYRPDFIAPSDANATRAVSDFDQLMQVPGAARYVDELAYHRYGGATSESLQAIGDRARSAGIRTAMLERIGSDYKALYEDLTVAMNSAWQQYALAFCQPADRGGLYYLIDVSDPNSPQVTLSSRGRYLRQYFRYVRAGAVRIGASSSSNALSPVAFVNAGGRHVVVVSTRMGGQVRIEGLPAGTYTVEYVTESAHEVAPAVTENGAVVFRLPAAGVATILAGEHDN
ncbi:MAG: hypothetical protein ACREMQ_22455 [Longimicrobiales bacterium]